MTIGSNPCTSVVIVSATQITCITRAGNAGAQNVVVTNSDGSTVTLAGGFTYTLFLAFDIRNSADTANTNTCALGTVSTSATASCSYRLKVQSNAVNGYTVYMFTSGGLTNSVNTITDALAGSGGAGGTNISGSTLGVEAYGIKVTPGTLTSGSSITVASAFNAGATNSVKANYLTSQQILQATGVNLPTGTDTTHTSQITNSLNTSGSTAGGSYSQKITYTVVANF